MSHLRESSFDCNRMISKTLRSLTDALNGLFSEAEILESFGKSFRLGYANRHRLRCRGHAPLLRQRQRPERERAQRVTDTPRCCCSPSVPDDRSRVSDGAPRLLVLRGERGAAVGHEQHVAPRDMLAGRPCDGRHESRAGEAPAGPFEGSELVFQVSLTYCVRSHHQRRVRRLSCRWRRLN